MHVCCLYYVYAYLNIDASLGTSERRRGRGHDMSGGRDSVPESKNFEFCIFYSRIFHTHMYNVCFYVLCFQLERKKVRIRMKIFTMIILYRQGQVKCGQSFSLFLTNLSI